MNTTPSNGNHTVPQKHAVLFYPDRLMPNETLMWIEGNGFHKQELPDPCTTLADLASVAYKNFITHLWVLPAIGQFQPTRSDAWNFGIMNDREGKMMGVLVRKKGHKEIDTTIIFPQHTSWWSDDQEYPSWLQQADAHEYLITLRYLEEVLNAGQKEKIAVGVSPGRVGWNHLKRLHPEWVELIEGYDLRANHFTGSAAPDIIWQCRELQKPGDAILFRLRGKRYIHKWDQNASYPYAATQVDIGVGMPLHVDHGRDMDDFITSKGTQRPSQKVGVWRCSIAYNGSMYDPHMPPIYKEHLPPRVDNEIWLSCPMIRLLRKLGHEVTCHEGNVFPEQHDVLTKWGKDFFHFAQEFDKARWVNKKCAGLAKQASKTIRNAMIGLTGSKQLDDDNEMKRPDIRMQVIARHTELVWHNINKIRELHGITPIIVYMDAVYYLSSEPDGRKVLPELVKRQAEMGGYKYEGRVELTPDVVEMLNQKMGANHRLGFLNRKGWER